MWGSKSKSKSGSISKSSGKSKAKAREGVRARAGAKAGASARAGAGAREQQPAPEQEKEQEREHHPSKVAERFPSFYWGGGPPTFNIRGKGLCGCSHTWLWFVVLVCHGPLRALPVVVFIAVGAIVESSANL